MSLRSRITGNGETKTDETNADGTGVRPTFTPAAETTVPRPAASADDTTAVPGATAASYPEPGGAGTGYPAGNAGEPVSVEPEQTALAYEQSPADDTVAAVSASTSWDAGQPLFSENPELRGQWQRVQSEFVDNPQGAVADAADLVQQAGQALVATLQQRQERMRSEWDRGSARATGTATDDEVTTTGGVDTEQLRQIMQRYRALFDQLSQPV